MIHCKETNEFTQTCLYYSDFLRQADTRLQSAMRWNIQRCTWQGRRPSKRMKHLWLLPLIRPGIAAPTSCALMWFQTRNGLVWTWLILQHLQSCLSPVACPFEYHGSGSEGTRNYSYLYPLYTLQSQELSMLYGETQTSTVLHAEASAVSWVLKTALMLSSGNGLETRQCSEAKGVKGKNEVRKEVYMEWMNGQDELFLPNFCSLAFW